MAEITAVIRLAEQALARGESLCLASVVRIEGSSYRKPGARMLLTSGGARAGTISGGCLEAEVARKAWWQSAERAALERYSSFFDDEEPMPYGLGCGGTVWVLIEQGEAARAAVEALQRVRALREPAVMVTSLGKNPGTRLVSMAGGERLYVAGSAPEQAVAAVLENGRSEYVSAAGEEFFCEYLAPPPALCLFGAGDDAQPVVGFAHALGWQVTVADGRSHLTRPERFPLATRTRVIDYTAGVLPAGETIPGPGDMAVLLTHSYEQDRAVLAALLPRPLAYLGVLGPRRRTERLVSDLLPGLAQRWPGVTAPECMARIRTPVGLDLGGDDPAAIALAIVAELQAVLHGRTVAVERRPVRNAQMPALLDAVGD